MSVRLVYRNSTPEVMAWAEDVKVRGRALHEQQQAWMTELYDPAGVADEHRGLWLADSWPTGLSWPDDTPLPRGWFRPVKKPQMIRPRSNTAAGREALRAMREHQQPDLRGELAKQFGLPYTIPVGLGLYRPGIRIEDDGVWVLWGSKDCEDRMAEVAAPGGARMPLVEFIERFGEDAL